MINNKLSRSITLILLIIILIAQTAFTEEWKDNLKKLSGDGSICVTDLKGNIVYSLREDKLLVPASILKIATASALLDTLDIDEFRFNTDFSLDSMQNLYVKGYGDPFFISEEIALIADTLSVLLKKPLNSLYLDNTYFEHNIMVPGISHSLNPYDALNSALLVNFNTIYVNVSNNGEVTSAEEQTPLTPLAKKLALSQGKKGKFRINLAVNPDKQLIYAGELIKEIFKKNGIQFKGGIEKRQVPEGMKPFYIHRSSKSIRQILAGLFEYSNNLVANQLMLYLGAYLYGPPANLDRGIRALSTFLKSRVGWDEFVVLEGSGICRQNKVTTHQMCELLQYFHPYKELLQEKDGIYSKTGSLHNVNTLAGYFDSKETGETLCFAILLNNKLTNREKIAKILAENL
ncbi:D-alanyl-D-alanine carboxypeptidase [bacterium]|nr:D-alanyl-D-alanine carboxypeptidase [bacterium]